MEAYCPAGSGKSYFKERFYLYLDRDLCKLFFFLPENEVLPFAAMWMDFEGIMLSDISQTRTNIIWFHLHVE